MTSQRYFEDINAGDTLPTVARIVDPVQMFLFSAATHNSHRIHYDRKWAVEVEGHRDIVVQGPLQSALMAQALTDWAGPQGRLVRIAMQNRAAAYPGDELRFVGTVISKREEGGEALVEIEIREEKASGEIVIPGSATVALPRRDSES
jgi:hydroxyacyl-ACP dehydratase HTD2-like protein with hotdog domain